MDAPLVTVGVVSSRPSLDLAINTWVPGYLARTSLDLDVILEQAGHDGIVLVDLVDVDRRATLQALADRGVDVPVLAVLPVGWEGDPLPGDPLTVTAPTETSPLLEALTRARRMRPSRPTRPTRRAAPSREPLGGLASGEHVIDLTDTGGPLPPDHVAVGAVLRGWALLDEVEGRLGGASAVIGVRATDGTYPIAAGIDLASYEAEQVIARDHPLLAALARGDGWLLRGPGERPRGAELPLQACGSTLAVALPGEDGPQEGLLLVGHFRAIDPPTAATVAGLAADRDHLHGRLRLRGAVTSHLDLEVLTGPGVTLPAAALPAAWRLLSRIHSHLRGPAVVLTRCSTGAYITTASQHLDAWHAARVVHHEHPLLERLRTEQGPVIVAPQPGASELVRRLPLPLSGHVGAFPVGDPAAPAAVVLIGRREPLTPDDRRWLAGAIADTEVPWQPVPPALAERA